jgi:hypothetical protein
MSCGFIFCGLRQILTETAWQMDLSSFCWMADKLGEQQFSLLQSGVQLT